MEFKPPVRPRVSDQELEHRVTSFLRGRGILGIEGLKVTARNGRVILGGRVYSQSAKWICYECCRHVTGVIDISDELTAPDFSPDDATNENSGLHYEPASIGDITR